MELWRSGTIDVMSIYRPGCNTVTLDNMYLIPYIRRHFGVFHTKSINSILLLAKKYTFLPACLQRVSLFRSCLCRFEPSPHWCASRRVCRWFVNRQRRWYAGPEIRRAKHMLCDVTTWWCDVETSSKRVRGWGKSGTPAQCVWCHLVPGEAAVDWVCVLKAVCLFYLVDFVLHSKPLLHKGLVGDDDLQILHHFTRRVYVYAFIVVSGGDKNRHNVTISVLVKGAVNGPERVSRRI